MIEQISIRPDVRKLRAIQDVAQQIARMFADAKYDILCYAIPKITMYPDGRVESIYPPEITEALEKLDSSCKEEIAIYLKSQGCEGAPKGEKHK